MTKSNYLQELEKGCRICELDKNNCAKYNHKEVIQLKIEAYKKGIKDTEDRLLNKYKLFCEICELPIEDDKELIQTGLSTKYTHLSKKNTILRNIGSYHKSCYKKLSKCEGEKTQ
jgi:hypothetical protein